MAQSDRMEHANMQFNGFLSSAGTSFVRESFAEKYPQRGLHIDSHIGEGSSCNTDSSEEAKTNRRCPNSDVIDLTLQDNSWEKYPVAACRPIKTKRNARLIHGNMQKSPSNKQGLILVDASTDEDDTYVSRTYKEPRIYLNDTQSSSRRLSRLEKSTTEDDVRIVRETSLQSSRKERSQDARRRNSKNQPVDNCQTDRLRISSTVSRAFTCPICLDDKPRGEQVCYFRCGHRFCFDCATNYVTVKVKDGQVAQQSLICPQEGCKVPLTVQEIRGCLSENAECMEKFENFSLKLFLERNPDSLFFCPTPACSNVIETGTFNEKEKYSCPACRRSYCLKCKAKWHQNTSCEDNAMLNSASKEDKKFLGLANRKGMKRCPTCMFWVEKSEGCNAMRCRCGTTFCWRCGDDVNKDAGCRCMRNIEKLSARDRMDVLQVNSHATNQRNPAHDRLQQRLQHDQQPRRMVGPLGWFVGY